METSVLLVDDHPLFRQGLRRLLEDESGFNIVGEASDGQTAIDLARELVPDVIVMDIAMSDLDGIEATRRIRAEVLDTKVIALSIHRERHFIEEMLQAGAVGYVLKESALEELVDGITTVNRGELYLSEAVRDVVIKQYIDSLSSEQDVTTQTKFDIDFPVSILVTKLYQPRIPARVVQRARLWEQLEQGHRRPLTLVSAPAGYGKSTVVSQWLDKCEVPSAWLSVDEQDNDLRTFLADFTASIQTLFAEAFPKTITLLRAANLPPLRILVNTLANELQVIPQRFVLVIDDYHRIDEPSVHDLISEILQHPPINMRLVIVTRVDPLLKLLQMRAQQRIVEIRVPDLRFTNAETQDYLEKVIDVPLKEEVAALLNERVEGWITGLRLITLSIQNSKDLESVSIVLPGQQQTLNYLIAEALTQQPREIQSWLLKTSILDRFCAPVCEAVCAVPEEDASTSINGEAFLRWLKDNNLFIVSLDGHNLWFRYHHLFQELLQTQLKNSLSAEGIDRLHTLASHWFAKSGLLEEGIKHALEAGDISYAVQLVENNRHDLMNRQQWNRLDRMLDLLPPGAVEKSPQLLLLQAHVHGSHKFNLEKIPTILQQVEVLLQEDESILSDQERLIVSGEIAALMGNLYGWLGQGQLALDNTNYAMEVTPTEHQWVYGLALTVHASAQQLVGQGEKGIEENWNILGKENTYTDLYAHQAYLSLIVIERIQGRLNAAARSAQELLRIAQTRHLGDSHGWALYILGEVNYQKNNLIEAKQWFTQAVEDRYLVQAGTVIQSYGGLALVNQAMLQPEEAEKNVNLAIEWAMEIGNPSMNIEAQALSAQLDLLQGKVLREPKWGSLLGDDIPLMLLLQFPHLTLARILLAQGTERTLEQANDLINRLLQAAEFTHNTGRKIEILALDSLLKLTEGDQETALDLLQQSLALSEPHGFIRLFVDLGPSMYSLLTHLKRQHHATAYLDQLLSAFPEETKSMAPPRVVPFESDHHPSLSTPIEPLTPRERRVLKYLATELSPKEIAIEMGISVTTVRSHIKHIYSKLAVHGRLKAVERAQDLGLLN